MGEVFDPAGMEVTVNYSDGKTEVVSNYDYSPKTPLTAQDTTITISYKGLNATVNITIVQLDAVLNNNTWQQIRTASDKNIASATWAVGDAKEITLNGTIGIATYNNFKTWVYILGFNHNSELEGNNMIHFGCFRNGQENTTKNGMCLTDVELGERHDGFNMNLTITSSGGWKGSYMRNMIIDADATLPLESAGDTFLHALPSDLKAVMKKCTKYTDNVGNELKNETDVTSTQDWAFLLSRFEVKATNLNGNRAEEKYQKQYEYYKLTNGNNEYCVKYSARNSQPVNWWLRSPAGGFGSSFAMVSSSGTTGQIQADYSYGFAPAFCV